QEHGAYPKELAELAPKYLTQVPEDLFSGKPLIYRPADKGYLLYSVGTNGVDDGGQGHGEAPPGDDLAGRIPLPELKRRKESPRTRPRLRCSEYTPLPFPPPS